MNLAYKLVVWDFLADYVKGWRAQQSPRLTQEDMAERLHISSRAYGDLERKTYCFSTMLLIYFLVRLSDEEALKLKKELWRLLETNE
mgnify:CR=1 FL=1